MAGIETALLSIGSLNELALQKSAIHTLDPRAKLITTLIFIITVVSFNKYDLSSLLPLVMYPVVLISVGNIPVGQIGRKLVLAAPFAVAVGIFNPFFDRTIITQLGPIGITGGWISFISLLLRFVLTVSAALILIATTGFEAMCLALDRLKVPRVFVTQLLFMYRYLFVLIAEALRVVRAYRLRAPQSSRIDFKVFGTLAGQLLLRTISRAQRIHLAMLSRGFDGHMHLARTMDAGKKDIVFILAWSSFFIMARVFNIPQFLGELCLRALA